MSRAAPSQRQAERYEAQIDAMVKLGLSGDSTVLELGVEHGHFAAALRQSFPACVIDGVDLWPEYLTLCGERGSYDTLGLADALECKVDHDFLVAGDIIEHMTKGDGQRLLGRMESLPNIGSVLTTPLGFMRMGAIEGNPYQEHQSGWEPDEFTMRGWTVERLAPGRRFGCYSFNRVGR